MLRKQISVRGYSKQTRDVPAQTRSQLIELLKTCTIIDVRTGWMG